MKLLNATHVKPDYMSVRCFHVPEGNDRNASVTQRFVLSRPFQAPEWRILVSQEIHPGAGVVTSDTVLVSPGSGFGHMGSCARSWGRLDLRWHADACRASYSRFGLFGDSDILCTYLLMVRENQAWSLSCKALTCKAGGSYLPVSFSSTCYLIYSSRTRSFYDPHSTVKETVP